jgi:hypothetical protein
MGRWCYFDNGFAYKFWFAVQDSGFAFLPWCKIEEEPMMEGRYNDETDEVDEDDLVETGEVRFVVKLNDTYLQDLAAKYPQFKMPEFDKYEKTDEGTSMIIEFIECEETTKEEEEENPGNFCLGCILYHMSLSKDTKELSGFYEC